MAEARKFGKAIWNITGKKDVDTVFEHPGEQTFPVSCFVVKRGGMVVFCAGTTRLQPHLRRALCLDAAEAHPGLAFRPSEAGLGGEQVRASTGASTPACRKCFPGTRFRTRTPRCGRTSTSRATWRVLVNAPRTGLRTFEDVIEASKGPGSNDAPSLRRPSRGANDRGVEVAAEDEDRGHRNRGRPARSSPKPAPHRSRHNCEQIQRDRRRKPRRTRRSRRRSRATPGAISRQRAPPARQPAMGDEQRDGHQQGGGRQARQSHRSLQRRKAGRKAQNAAARSAAIERRERRAPASDIAPTRT